MAPSPDPADSDGGASDPVIARAVLDSRILGERRPYRVLLPPGYAASSARRYPVLYLHDGQAAFDDDPHVLGGLLDGLWPALDPGGRRIHSFMAAGGARPALVVAVDALSLHTRIRDYLPPGDRYLEIAGAADRYVRFVVEELKPAVDAAFRTQPGRDDTVTAGFSFGGVVAFYLGWQHADRCRGVGSLSGGFWASRFPGRVATDERRDLRIYLDTGDDNLDANAALCRLLQSRAYVLGRDLRCDHRPGHAHHPEHFAAGLGPMLCFLFPD
jgi:predicted alpha/beta superfamily hydrolase